MNENYVIEVMRTGEYTSEGHVCGVMTIKKDGVELGKLRTLERGLTFTNMKIGTYQMKHSRKRKGRQVKCLRPTNPWITAVLVHDAAGDKASNLEGCIAPFLFGTEADYKRSADAMEKLWMMLGGFAENQKYVTLKVLNNYPNEHRTAEQWIAQRKEAALKAAAKRKAAQALNL